MSWSFLDTFKATIERVTGAVTQIDTDHKYIHAGDAYEASDVVVGSTVAIKKYSFVPTSTAGSEKYVHFRPTSINIEKGVMTFEIWEGSTKASTGATAITPYNRNRGCSKVSEFSLKRGDGSTAPSSTGSYKKIHASKVWGGSGGAGNNAIKIGAGTGQPLEWVLKQNAKYVIAVGTTEAYSANFFWYEELDG